MARAPCRPHPVKPVRARAAARGYRLRGELNIGASSRRRQPQWKHVAPTGFEPVFEQGHVFASSHEILQIVTLRKMWRDSNTDLLRHHSRPRWFSNPCVALKQLPTGATRRAHP